MLPFLLLPLRPIDLLLNQSLLIQAFMTLLPPDGLDNNFQEEPSRDQTQVSMTTPSSRRRPVLDITTHISLKFMPNQSPLIPAFMIQLPPDGLANNSQVELSKDQIPVLMMIPFLERELKTRWLPWLNKERCTEKKDSEIKFNISFPFNI